MSSAVQWWRSAVLCLSFCLVALHPGTAHGQTPSDKEHARAAADAGADAFESGRYDEAIDRFMAAEALVHAPPHVLHIARSHAKLGHLLVARDTYLAITREVLAADAPEVFKVSKAAAESELATLEARIPRLTVLLKYHPSVNAADKVAQVSLDDTPVAPDAIGVGQMVEVGEHSVRASAPGMRETSKTVNLAEAGAETVTLELDPIVQASALAEAPSAGSLAQGRDTVKLQPTASTPSYQRIVGYAALGVGALGLAGGTVALLSARSVQSDADATVNACRPQCTEEDRSTTVGLDDKASDRRNLAVAGFVVGGVGVAAGITLLVLSGHRESPTTVSGVQPLIGPGFVGLDGHF